MREKHSKTIRPKFIRLVHYESRNVWEEESESDSKAPLEFAPKHH